MANFKDKVQQKEEQKVAREELAEQKKQEAIIEEQKVVALNNKFSDKLLVEEVTNKIKEEITEDFRKELEAGLRREIEESVRNDVSKQVEKELAKNLDERILESNKSIVDTMSKVIEKLDKLNEGLNIEVPTPIVHVNMPTVTRKVNRNKEGLVESITEEFDDNEEG
jgi:hypothetical protein